MVDVVIILSGADYGMLTILKTSEVGGLQIHLDGTWIDVDPVEGFIVNLGEPLFSLLKVWSPPASGLASNSKGRAEKQAPLPRCGSCLVRQARNNCRKSPMRLNTVHHTVETAEQLQRYLNWLFQCGTNGLMLASGWILQGTCWSVGATASSVVLSTGEVLIPEGLHHCPFTMSTLLCEMPAMSADFPSKWRTQLECRGQWCFAEFRAPTLVTGNY